LAYRETEHTLAKKADTRLRLLKAAPFGAARWLCGCFDECGGGGVGYVEEIMPRLYRKAPVNAIWEGSGNVQCLDVPLCV
jgi:alkylation response protein AidB-like acyl-CoA dehydrogenase